MACAICGGNPLGLIGHRCSANALRRRERDLSDYDDGDDDDTRRVFTNCNVCGRKLHSDAEDKMGMCLICAAE